MSHSYEDVELVPGGAATAFIMFDRKTGRVAYYDLESEHNGWVWEQLGPASRIPLPGESPAKRPE